MLCKKWLLVYAWSQYEYNSFYIFRTLKSNSHYSNRIWICQWEKIACENKQNEKKHVSDWEVRCAHAHRIIARHNRAWSRIESNRMDFLSNLTACLFTSIVRNELEWLVDVVYISFDSLLRKWATISRLQATHTHAQNGRVKRQHKYSNTCVDAVHWCIIRWYITGWRCNDYRCWFRVLCLWLYNIRFNYCTI